VNAVFAMWGVLTLILVIAGTPALVARGTDRTRADDSSRDQT